MDEVENFFLPISKAWALRVSGMGGYTSKCEKKSKSLHPNVQSSMYTMTAARLRERRREGSQKTQFFLFPHKIVSISGKHI